MPITNLAIDEINIGNVVVLVKIFVLIKYPIALIGRQIQIIKIPHRKFHIY